MQSPTVVPEMFKPFLIAGGHGGKEIFRVVELLERVRREQIEQLLEKLPIRFQIRDTTTGCSLNEPLEVEVNSTIVRIYPPPGRMLTCTSFAWWHSVDELLKQTRVDNLMDCDHPGGGQIRSCVHFDPVIFGITDWPVSTPGAEIELDIFVYPRSK